jgi:hypothetical protein
MIDDPLTRSIARATRSLTPGITAGAPRRPMPSTIRPRKSARFVTTSHSLSAPAASPSGVLVAATIAIALYFLGRRLSD